MNLHYGLQYWNYSTWQYRYIFLDISTVYKKFFYSHISSLAYYKNDFVLQNFNRNIEQTTVKTNYSLGAPYKIWHRISHILNPALYFWPCIIPEVALLCVEII